MRRGALFALLLFGCEDQALLDLNAELVRELKAAKTKKELLMRRREALASAPGTKGSLVGASPEVARARILALGSSDSVEVELSPGRLDVVVSGERGRRQAAQALLAYGVDAPQLKLKLVEVDEPKWRMNLESARVAPVTTATVTELDIEIPEPSFFSFGEGEKEYHRAGVLKLHLEKVNAINAKLEASIASQRVGVVDEASSRLFRARRYFAIALLPDVKKGRLTFTDDRATWKGATTFTTLDEAKDALDGRGEVIGFAPGERGSLEAKLRP